MQIDSLESLIQAIQASGLFTPEQLPGLVRELSTLGDELPVLLRHLKKHLTVYQIRKLIHGKAAELFVGSYVITDKIGEGGMGKVYRARQIRLGREVALKIVRSSLLVNPVIRKRYDREVETASALNHPNIVAVFDAGEVDGKYYLAMEFVDGIDLAHLVHDHSPLEVAEACEYVRQAALGLQYAHDQGFVHRDVKPSNIVVAGERHVPQATEPAVVKILDMGLVRTVGFDDGGAGGGDLTRAGTVVGTPDYMAPEQAKNSSAVDQRADQYSLGCTLYFLLTSQPPFPVGTPIEKLLKHQLDAPTPLQALRRDVPDAVAEIVARLIAKNPEERFPSAGTVAERLAPLCLYPRGSQAVTLRKRREQPSKPTVDTLPSSRSAGSPAFDSGSSPQSGPQPEEPVPLAQPVAPSDQTPRPLGLSPPLNAPVESISPFSSMTEPTSGEVVAVTPAEAMPPPPAAPTPRRTGLWIAVVILVLVGTGVGLWAAFGGFGNQPQPTPPDVEHPSPRIVPNVNLTRLHPRLDLVPDGAGLVVVAYPSAYFKANESPFVRGSGPVTLASWIDRLNADTALPLARSDRVVFTVLGGNWNRFLLVSEGDYLTAKFGEVLEKHPKLQVPKQPPKTPAGTRVFSLPGNRFTAMISPQSGQPAHALASDWQLVSGLINRLTGTGKSPPPPLINPGMLAALNVPQDNPQPLVFAVAGPALRLPFKDAKTLQDFGISLATLRAAINERMELELAFTGKNKETVQQFLTTLGQKIREEYPLNGGEVLSLLNKASRAGEEVDGKYRLTLKATLTPEEWSAFLDRLFAEKR